MANLTLTATLEIAFILPTCTCSINLQNELEYLPTYNFVLSKSHYDNNLSKVLLWNIASMDATEYCVWKKLTKLIIFTPQKIFQ